MQNKYSIEISFKKSRHVTQLIYKFRAISDQDARIRKLSQIDQRKLESPLLRLVWSDGNFITRMHLAMASLSFI